MMECIGDAEGVRDGRRRPLFKAGDDLRLEMNEWIKPDISIVVVGEVGVAGCQQSIGDFTTDDVDVEADEIDEMDGEGGECSCSLLRSYRSSHLSSTLLLLRW